ncbi:DUF4426 domain-containing protein [Marilutibacter alkalisoli]|uniref:DUF4426 domain-containing protein n=1 Tax=Marilutibacter alkalisoli TaxID=2591633 RepID=A0A514BPL2_9GAMM|nr:DUF4426 domain-containing protein [Lysobacter alkalisoli]QDH69320.1 DUF4426 domain-containing protein [Lysobacter alkalisoli]
MTRCLAAAALAAFALVAGCGRSPSTPSEGRRDGAAMMEEAVATAGDVTVRASVVSTARLNEAVARQYGVERNRGRVLVLVGVRQGPESDEASLPAVVRAEVSDLRGVRQRLVLEEVRSGDLIDHAGSVRVTPPDTLRFDISVEPEGKAPIRLQFNRDIFPD